MKLLFVLVVLIGTFSCSKKEEDKMKECMKTMSHMQCVKKLSKE